MLLVDKYKPKTLSDIRGQDEALVKLKQYVLSSKPVLIYGPPGNGKTCSACVLARDMDYELVEINASDFRNKNKIENVVGNAIKQKSLISRGKIILIDEVDSITSGDRGGVQALTNLLDGSTFPIIITSNNPWDSKFSALRKKCRLIEFKALDYKTIFHVLKEICDKEKIKYEQDFLKNLAMRSSGDLRAAINDLQILSLKGKFENLDFGEREREKSIFNALRLIFKSKSKDVLNAFDNVDLDYNECLLWLDENLPREYMPDDLKEAYYYLSRADVFSGRIRRQQHWRFLVYIYALLTVGIAISKKEKNTGFINYQRTKRILKLWLAKTRNAKKKALAGEIASETHTSAKKIMKDMPMFERIWD